MRLLSVRLKNIRSYTDCTIEFSSGSTLLAGDIGSGKSSILLGIEFALFGIVRGNLDGATLLRNGADRGEVELSFEVNGKKVSVVRTLKRSKDDVRQEGGHIIIDGNKTIGTTVELKSAVLELLGYPREALTKSKPLIYRYTVYTPQEEMRRILSDESEAREETLRRVFGVDKYSRCAQNAQIIMRSLREERRINDTKSEGLAALEERHDGFALQLSEEQEKLADAAKSIADIEKAIIETRRQLREFENGHTKHKELTGTAAAIQASTAKTEELLSRNRIEHEALIKAQESARAELKELAPTGNNLSLTDAEAALKRAESELAYAKQKHALHEQMIANSRKRRDEIDAEISRALPRLAHLEAKKKRVEEHQTTLAELPRIESALQQMESTLQDTGREEAKHRAHLEHARSVLERIHSIETCPTCLQDISIGHKERISGEHSSTINALQDTLTLIEAKLAATQAQTEESRQKHARIIQLRNEMLVLKSEIQTLEETGRDVEEKRSRRERLAQEESVAAQELANARIGELETVAEAARAAFARANEQRLITQKKESIEARIADISSRIERRDAEKTALTMESRTYATELTRVLNELSALSGIAAQREKTEQDLGALIDNEKGLLVRKTGCIARIEHLKQNIADLTKEIASKNEARMRSEHLGMLISWLHTIALPSLSLMEQQVLARVYHEFNDRFRTWFAMLMEDDTITARLDRQFAPVVEQNGYETGIESLSGGEKTSCALAYRLAITKVINDLIASIQTKDLLILDEPTEGFSAEQLDRVRGVLAELSLHQIIIVSHEQKIESFVDHVIRIGKQGHQSSAS